MLFENYALSDDVTVLPIVKYLSGKAQNIGSQGVQPAETLRSLENHGLLRLSNIDPT